MTIGHHLRLLNEDGDMGQWLRSSVLTQVWFSVPILGSSQQPITLASGASTLLCSTGTCPYVHMPTHPTQMRAQMHMYTKINMLQEGFLSEED